MRKLKKIFSMFACLAMVTVSAFSLTACSSEEIADNTETVIETTTSIIPVDLSKGTAQGIYATALENLLNSKAYEYTFKGKQSETNIMTLKAVGALNANGQRYVYAEAKNSSTEQKICEGYYGEKYCTLNLINKTYTEDASHTGLIIGQQVDSLAGTMLSNIVSGRYYNGFYYITAEYTDSTQTHVIEVLIKDSMIVKAHFVSIEDDDTLIQYAQLEFNYTDVDTSKVVMSLDSSYTKV